MEITHRPLREITFDDVSEFCAKQFPEGFQLDYKKDLSDKGLKKHFASFSNAHGGLIIIGVEEDEKTGLPKAWSGVSSEGKHEDRIHQFASSIDPLPSYEVHTTSPGDNGNIFVLIRIAEGDVPPYYIHNDANIYLRTGNITMRCEERASPQETARLFKKQDLSAQARTIQLQQAEELYVARIREFELQAKKECRLIELNNDLDWKPSRTLARFTLQPAFPNKPFVTPQTVQRIVCESYMNARNMSHGYSWVCSNYPRSIPSGVIAEQSSVFPNPRFTEFQAVLATGLAYGVKEIAQRDNALHEKEKGLTIYPPYIFCVESLMWDLGLYLVFMRYFYSEIGYKGVLHGQVALDVDCNVSSALFERGLNTRSFKETLKIPYRWPITLDTSVLDSTSALEVVFVDLYESIAWGLGWSIQNRSFIEETVRKFPLFRE